MDARSQLDALLDLDARHDELLRDLAELDMRIVRVLEEYTRAKRPVVENNDIEPESVAAGPEEVSS